MRPGFYTRKSIGYVVVAVFDLSASMRPGFYTRKSFRRASTLVSIRRGFNEAGILHPEKHQWAIRDGSILPASMRPGFYTRKSKLPTIFLRSAIRSFNEAGILHPEKLTCAARPDVVGRSFNEAGILHPEKPLDDQSAETLHGLLQ